MYKRGAKKIVTPEENEESKETKTPKKSENDELLDDLSRSKKELETRSFLKHLQARISEGSLNLFESGINGLFDEYREFTEEKEKSVTKYLAFETVAANAIDTIEYYILLIFSCLIATMGLYQNSAAVIIGAMIVAPLIGPILGLSAGALWGSGKTIIESFTTLLKGIGLVILITWGMTALMPYIQVSDEILARSHPGLGDIIIAIASGIIGSYAYVNKRVSSSIPGVAISVALMPPLCTIGIGLGLQNWSIANGALLLFCINLIGISFAAIIVFYLVKLHPENRKDEEKVRLRFISQLAVTVLLLLIIVVPLSLFTVRAVGLNSSKQELKTIIEKNINPEEIYDSRYAVNDDGGTIRLILYSDKRYESEKIESMLRNVKKGIRLNIFYLTP